MLRRKLRRPTGMCEPCGVAAEVCGACLPKECSGDVRESRSMSPPRPSYNGVRLLGVGYRSRSVLRRADGQAQEHHALRVSRTLASHSSRLSKPKGISARSAGASEDTRSGSLREPVQCLYLLRFASPRPRQCNQHANGTAQLRA